jgi:hypothetical protein
MMGSELYRYIKRYEIKKQMGGRMTPKEMTSSHRLKSGVSKGGKQDG